MSLRYEQFLINTCAGLVDTYKYLGEGLMALQKKK